MTDPSTRYHYDERMHRWRETATGRLVSQARVAEARDGFLAAQEDRVRSLAHSLLDGTTVQRWEGDMRQVVRTTFVAEYSLGRGGVNALSPADRGRVGSLVRTQYQYLRDFALEVQRGELSVAQIASRSVLYVHSAGQAYERARAAARDLVLPAYPKDGSTECKSRCGCRWEISETDTSWRCYWRKTSRESCPTCIERARVWSPLDVPKSSARFLRDLRRYLADLVGATP